MDFTDWLIELIEDERWHENATRYHSKETFEKTAYQVYVTGSTKPDTFFISPMAEHRNHVFNKLCKLPHDKKKKDWVAESLKQEEEKRKATEPEWVPLTGEERQRRLQEFLDKVQATPPIKRIAPLSHKEILENGQWKPKPSEIREPSEVEKAAALNNHIAKIQAARSKLYLDGYPDASKEEVQAYLDSFEVI